MKDIKSLYLTAKQSGRQQDVNSYIECVRDYLENSPFQYISNLEYIISSSIGLSTLKEFVDRNGISIGSYNDIMTCLESGMKKCRLKEQNDSAYKEAVSMMESFKEKYHNCFIMFEAFQDGTPGNLYIEAYYKNFPLIKKAEKGKINLSGIISRFGEACIPDILVYTSRFGNADVILESLYMSLESLKSDKDFYPPKLYQWVLESAKDIPNKSEDVMNSIYSKSLQGIVESVKTHNIGLYRESVLTGNDNIIQEYSEEELKAMENLISFKEYQVTCLENVNDITNIQSQIYSLYEEFEGLVEEDVATSVIPMLPGSNQKVSNVKESWLSNTQNKKAGTIPDYIKRNHDLGYGEDDPVKKHDDGDEPVLDDFKRPSASKSDKSDDNAIVPYDYSQNDDKSHDKVVDSELTPEERKNINNYYYYTYTNSNNKNSNSFNRHHQDDHSTAKRINSNDNIHHDSAMGESWTIEKLLAIPLTELAHLPEESYDLYHEATSVIITEAEGVAIDLNSTMANGKEVSLMQKLKAMMMKLINYLIDLYGRLFPKTLLSFSKLEKKFKANEKIQKMCKDNDKILKIMELDIPHVSGVDAAVRDLVNFANTGKLPSHKIEDYKREGTNKVIIYWGGYSEYSEEKDFMFCIATNSPTISIGEQWKAINKKSRMNVATYLSEGNLLKVFGVNVMDETGKLLTIREIEYILGYAKTKIDISIELWKNREARQNLLSILKGLTEITNHVYRTMNQAYREAVNLLKKAESGFYESPLELNIFENNKLYSEEVDEFDEGMAASLLVNEKDMRPLNDDERAIVAQLFGKVKCTFMKAKAGYFAMTNRARTSFYRKLEDIPKAKVAFISSTAGAAAFESAAVGTVDDQKPESDNPIQDAMTDLDRKLTSAQQAVKKKVQGVVNTTRTITKPFRRTSQWISNMVSNWKDANENDIKERLADPHARSNLFSALKSAIKYGSLFKAGLLLNPIILYLTLSKKFSNSSKEFRIRTEMIGELKAELSIIDAKIQDADRAGDNKAKYQLMRFKNELNKKLIRVGGTKGMAKMV
jgi:hypothetical protein